MINDLQSDIIDKYIAALNHPQAVTRLRAAWILGILKNNRAAEPLRAIVKERGNGDPYLLKAAVKSLGSICDKESVSVLSELLSDSESSFMARVESASALAQIGNADAITELQKALHDNHPRIREEANAAIKEFFSKKIIQPEDSNKVK